MSEDLISREALKKRLNEMFETFDVVLFDDIIATIDNAPTVDIYTIEDIQVVRKDALIMGAKLAQIPKYELANEVWQLYEKHSSHLATHVIEFGDELKELLSKYQKTEATI